MTNVEPGEILLSQEIECRRGRISAKTGSELVSIFLGSIPNGTQPAAMSLLNSLGWVRTDFFEIRLDAEKETIDETTLQDFNQRTFFQAGTPAEALNAAVRYANRWSSYLGAKLVCVRLTVVRIGTIDNDGCATHKQSDPILYWDVDDHSATLEDHVAAILSK